MDNLSNTLKVVLKEIKQKNEKNQLDIRTKLNKILTKKESQHIKYISFYKDTLRLGIDSSVWLYCLNQKKEIIIKKLKIKDLKLHLA